MIQQLLAQIESGWQEMVAGHTPAPSLTLLPGKLELSQQARDRSGQPRPQPARQILELRLPATRYTLDKTPLASSLRVQAIFRPGQLDERALPLSLPDEYRIDETGPALLLTPAGAAKVEGAASLLVSYRFVGVYALQEFKQLFHAHVHAPDLPQAEQWASLLIALLLTEQEALMEDYNNQTQTVYAAGDYAARHSIDQIRLLEGEPEVSEEGVLWRLLWQVNGRLELGKQTRPAFDLIEQVVSPGRTDSAKPIDIEAQVVNKP